ncbi:MAG TPA: OsmC family protein [Solirubrobacteraceae bacterium]|jgi:organic hydroperoxide reductase OsmC/OhrA
MTGRAHRYEVTVVWTGNQGEGTSGYRSYARDHEVTADSRPPLKGSSDRAFRGNAQRWDPERLLVAALSQCHLLSYLHVCAEAGVVVVDYVDQAEGEMQQTPDGGGHFTEVTLRPRVTVSEESMTAAARDSHGRAHELCFIANSVNFPVLHEPRITVA